MDARVQPQSRRNEGAQFVVRAPKAELLDSTGNRQREILFGSTFRVLRKGDATESNLVWGFSEQDGYLGWIERSKLGGPSKPTHRICVARTLAKHTPDMKVTENLVDMSLGSLLKVTDSNENYVQFELSDDRMWIPAQHVTKIDDIWSDPAGIAELLIGTPYLWGGNSAFGIDCSGLVQLSANICGMPCPADSDQQAEFFGGDRIERRANRNDLFFWKGHVAIALNPTEIIHANAHSMAVSIEPLADAIVRIEKSGEGPVIARGRLSFKKAF